MNIPDRATLLSGAWEGFHPGRWQQAIDVRDFILSNVTPYQGDASFLSGPTARTREIWDTLTPLFKQERDKGILDASTDVGAAITAHGPGYILKDKELIVGLQTDAPLKRAIMPFSGVRMVEAGLNAYGYQLSDQLKDVFTRYRKDHNQGTFDCYSPEIRAARKSGIITGLPDAYGRGRIIGDYRRVALYGIDRLSQERQALYAELDDGEFTEDVIRLREELSEQYRALQELKSMAASYGHDISQPAQTAQQAIQWVYFGYLGAIKEQNGAASPLAVYRRFSISTCSAILPPDD
jgi:formate C-acetyltransferase